jgi:sulfur carrier protein ThiS adenylyltransferase
MSERYSRQKDIVPERVKEVKVVVVGVGAIGRNVSLQLASMGVENIKLIDFDTVEEHNVASQGFLEADIGSLKVEAVERSCRAINKDIKVEAINDRYRLRYVDADVLFCCVDSMDIRGTIWNGVKEEVELFVDGRMSAETMRIFAANKKFKADAAYYEKNLFSDSEAYVGSCTAKTTIYCANVAAGLMVSQFTKWLRSFPTNKEVNFNLLTSELGVVD